MTRNGLFVPIVIGISVLFAEHHLGAPGWAAWGFGVTVAMVLTR